MTLLKSFEQLDYSQALESSTEAQKWLEKHGRRFGQFINGKFDNRKNAELIASNNPSNGELLAHIEVANSSQLDAAVTAARKAQPKWQALGGHGRAKVLYALARLLQKHTRLTAVLETLDNGKPIRESRDIDIPLVIRHFYHHAGWAQLQEQELSSYEPIGVAAQIVPWNFPLLMLAWKIAPAIAMGNTIVFKSAEQTPITAMFFAHLCEQAGVPSGVVNIVNGAGDVGASLAAHKGVDKVAFTGSTAMGRRVAEVVSQRFGKTILELGGNNAIIVDDTADLDLAIPAIAFGAVGTAGQRCTSTRRVIAQTGIADTLIKRLINAYKQVHIGDPLEKGTLMGPLLNQGAVDAYMDAISAITAAGGEIVYGGNPIAGAGFYVEPTIARVNNDWDIVQNETFAPILYIIEFEELGEALELHNAVPQGLSSSMFTTKLQHAEMFLSAAGSDCGIANINIGTSGAEIGGAFGGEKETGGGRESGSDSWKQYMRRQTNTINWSDDLPLAQGITFDI